MLEMLQQRKELLDKDIEKSLSEHQGLMTRIEQVKDQSVANHNALIGRRLEVEKMIEDCKSKEDIKSGE